MPTTDPNAHPTWVSPDFVVNPKTGNIYPKVVVFSDNTISVMWCYRCFNGEHKNALHHPSKTIYIGDECYEDSLNAATIHVHGFRLVQPEALSHPFILPAFAAIYKHNSLQHLSQAEVDDVVKEYHRTHKPRKKKGEGK